MVRIHSFTLQLKDVIFDDELADIVFRAGCDDAMITSHNNKIFLSFARLGNSKYLAIKSAKDDLKNAGLNYAEV